MYYLNNSDRFNRFKNINITNTVSYFTKFFTLLTLIVLSGNSQAFSSQWPLRAKGEVYYLKVVKVYDASLFSPQALSADTILKPHVSKCLQLDYAVSLSQDKFRKATDVILKRQHTSDYLNQIKQPLETLQKAYKPVKKGDMYRLCYDGKSQRIRLSLNQTTLVEIQSAELAKAYMGIWLSDNKPISMPLYRRFFPTKK